MALDALNYNENNNALLVRDLLVGACDDELMDMCLVAGDGTRVPACRFVLAARSLVLKCMLYGKFRESGRSEVHLSNYNADVLRGIVEYCSKGSAFLKHNNQGQNRNERFVRYLSNLYKAADFLDLLDLREQTLAEIRTLISLKPWLACAAFDEADPATPLEDIALQMVKFRPYVTLLPPQFQNNENDNINNYESEGGGGVECLKAEKLMAVMRHRDIEAGELFMFEMLMRWVDHKERESNNKDQSPDCAGSARNVAMRCALYFRLHYIEPHELMSKVMGSNLIPADIIVSAILRQAVKASSQEDRVLKSRCRGPVVNGDRVLVEGAGNPDVNGVYHRISGLTNGDIYSKHELQCGQMYVYTLSCKKSTTTKANTNSANNINVTGMECRIICSKILTHQAVPTLSNPIGKTSREGFQPLLQLILDDSSNSVQRSDGSGIKEYQQCYLSDGEYYISVTLGLNVLSGSNKNNALIKLLHFERYKYPNHQKLSPTKKKSVTWSPSLNNTAAVMRRPMIHVTNACVIGSINPGQTLGSPIDISSLPRDDAVFTEVATVTDDNNSDPNKFLQQLYFCNSTIGMGGVTGTNHSIAGGGSAGGGVPRSGWEVDEHGVGPSPKCAWIPAEKSPSSTPSSPSRKKANTTAAENCCSTNNTPTNNNNKKSSSFFLEEDVQQLQRNIVEA